MKIRFVVPTHLLRGVEGGGILQPFTTEARLLIGNEPVPAAYTEVEKDGKGGLKASTRDTKKNATPAPTHSPVQG